jgi:hypothetical protein
MPNEYPRPSDRNAAAGRVLVVLVLLAASFAGSAGAGAGSPGVFGSTTPIVSVIRHGGLCVTGRECRSTLRIDDTTISGDGYVPRRLKASERVALLRAIGRLDAKYLQAHPFVGTCPTAYDGSESIYRFRGFPRSLASCTSDLRGVDAVRLAERFATLRPKHQ